MAVQASHLSQEVPGKGRLDYLRMTTKGQAGGLQEAGGILVSHFGANGPQFTPQMGAHIPSIMGSICPNLCEIKKKIWVLISCQLILKMGD